VGPATRLAALGHAVTLLEQADTVGGKLGWHSRDGRGAVVRTGAAVRRVLIEGGRALRGELADGDVVPADVVVSGTDAAALYADLLPPDRRTRGVRRNLSRTRPSVSGFVLLLAA
jgi:phytoene dehydrogenase-like protein